MSTDKPKPQYGVVFPDGRIEWDSFRLGPNPETAETQGKAQDQYLAELKQLGLTPDVFLSFVKREWVPGNASDITK